MNELLAFVKHANECAAEIKREFSSAKFQFQKKNEIAALYGVDQNLFGGDSFWKECGRKRAIKNLKK